MAHTLLFVDDEENILKALGRLFHRSGHEIVTAEGGEQALEILKTQPISLIISDQRMPGMSGTELLTQARQLQPHAVRVMLTGHSDMEAVLQAINQGQIYRFVPKPWDDDALRAVVTEALADVDMRREHAGLQARLLRHNDELQELNASLEGKVRERTAELKRVLELSDGLNQTLRRRNVETIKAFAGLLELRSPALAAHCRRVAALVPKVCANLDIRDRDVVQQMIIAALLHDIGKIALPDSLLAKDPSQVGRAEREELMRHPTAGEAQVLLVEGMEDVARMIRHHHENADGSGYPDGLIGDAIPLGARVLRLLNTYDKLSQTAVGVGGGAKMIVEALRQQLGRSFDHPVLDALFKALGIALEEAPAKREAPAKKEPPLPPNPPAAAPAREEAPEGGSRLFSDAAKSRRYTFQAPNYNTVSEMRVRVEQITEGMILSRDLCADDGTLLIRKNEPIEDEHLKITKSRLLSFSLSPLTYAYVYRDNTRKPTS